MNVIVYEICMKILFFEKEFPFLYMYAIRIYICTHRIQLRDIMFVLGNKRNITEANFKGLILDILWILNNLLKLEELKLDEI